MTNTPLGSNYEDAAARFTQAQERFLADLANELGLTRYARIQEILRFGPPEDTDQPGPAQAKRELTDSGADTAAPPRL